MRAVRGALADAGIVLQTCKDHVVFEAREILTQSGTPYGVFTPYKNNWLSRHHAAATCKAATHPAGAGAGTPAPELAAARAPAGRAGF